LDGRVVDENVSGTVPLGGLTHALWSLRIAEIATERRHATPWINSLYLASDLGERRLIARDEQQISAMCRELASTETAQTAVCTCDDRQHCAQ